VLSRLLQLKHAFLTLWFSVGPDEEYWDEEIDREYPLSFSFSGEEIPFAHLRKAFSNSAIDASLVLSIFNLISSSASLSYLRHKAEDGTKSTRIWLCALSKRSTVV
jgi:hypothetical protein